MTDWRATTLAELLEPVSERAGVEGPGVVLSVTEHRGVIPQAEVFKKRIATVDTAKYKVMEPLDIAYNPYLLWTGAVGQWLGSSAGVTSPVYECFRVREPHDARFVGLLLESGQLTPYFDSTAIGSIKRRRRTTLPVFLAAPVEVPEPEAQRRIVDLIVTADAHLAALRDEIDRADHVYSGMRESLVNGPCRRLGEVLLAIDAGRSPWTTGDPPRDNEPAVLKVSAVAPLEFRPTQSKVLPSDHQMSKAWEVRPGDVLITRANTPDRVGAVCRAPDDTRPDLYLCDKTLRLRPNLEIRADYLTEALNLGSVRRHLMSASTGTSKSMFNISQDAIRLTEIPVPRLERQADVAESLELARSTVRSLGDELASLTDARSATLVALLNREIEIPGSYDALVESA